MANSDDYLLAVELRGSVSITIRDGTVSAKHGAVFELNDRTLLISPCECCSPPSMGGSSGGNVMVVNNCSFASSSYSSVSVPGGSVLIKGQTIRINVGDRLPEYEIYINGLRAVAPPAAAEAKPCTKCRTKYKLPSSARISRVFTDVGRVIVHEDMLARRRFEAEVNGAGTIETQAKRASISTIIATLTGMGKIDIDACATDSLNATMIGMGRVNVRRRATTTLMRSCTGLGRINIDVVA